MSSSTPRTAGETHWRKLALLPATWFHSGRLTPRLPGAVVTLCALALVPMQARAEIHRFVLVVPTLLVFLLLAGVLAWAALRHCGASPGQVVVQHVPGLLLAALLIPMGWVSLAVVWCCYQATSGLQPWPVGALRRAVPGATGLLLSACFAGLWANLVARTVLMMVGF